MGRGVVGRGDVHWSFKLDPSRLVVRRGLCEVIDMQKVVHILPGGVTSPQLVNTIMEMQCGFFESQCLSWLTRWSDEPVRMATVTE